ncbi:MAG TPA: hypothetical protein VKC63_08640 [Solirubrobacterales bacterium]|nr:hypothetical protein [Solirubrobacterales bacterium]
MLVAIDIWWFETYRNGFPLDVDEAGYTTIGLIDYLGLKGGGLHGWWEAIQTQTPNAPLTPALQSLLAFVKPGVLDGFAVLTGFVVVLAFAIYGIGTRLAGPRLGALVALVTAAAPGTFIYAREYVFALPAAALLACAVFALLQSDGLRRRRLAIACGAALGLMLLARTMTVAFVPGVLAAAVLTLGLRQQGKSDLLQRLLNLGLLVLTGFAVAATWYWRNLQSVIDYLTSYGYGDQAKFYGAEHSLLSWARFQTVSERMIFDDLLVPLAVLVFAGLVTIGVVAVRRLLDGEDRRAELERLAASDAFGVFVVFAVGYAALMSSQNGGDGFTFPLAVLLLPLAVVALRLFRRAALPVIALLCAVTALNVAASSTIWDSVSKTRLVEVPGYGEMPWVNGVPHAVGAIRVQVPGSLTHFDDRDHGWTEIDKRLAHLFLQPVGPEGQQGLVAFASRNRVISSNSVGLAAVITAHKTIPFSQLAAEPSDSVGAYAKEIGPEGGLPAYLVTMSRNTEDFPIPVTQAYAETAAREAGFRKIRTMELPDGRQLYVWRRAPE